jgi:hypothetical protein
VARGAGRRRQCGTSGIRKESIAEATRARKAGKLSLNAIASVRKRKGAKLLLSLIATRTVNSTMSRDPRRIVQRSVSLRRAVSFSFIVNQPTGVTEVAKAARSRRPGLNSLTLSTPKCRVIRRERSRALSGGRAGRRRRKCRLPQILESSENMPREVS